MEGAGFLKTVSFGGFDKKDVLQYVDKLNTQIYTLENELNEKKALLEASGNNSEAAEKYEKLLNENRATITELQTNNESLKNQLKNAEDEAGQKDKEIADLKAKLAAMEDELIEAKNKAAAASNVENNAMDLSNVFMEAQKSAASIVTNAKENARKMDEDARKLANQVVDDANSKASTIVKSADEKALRIVTDAESKSEQMRTASENMKAVVLAEVAEISNSINLMKGMLDHFTKDGLATINETSKLLANTEDTLKKNGIPTFTPPKGTKMAQPAPAPIPQAVQRPVQPAPVQRPVQPAHAAPAPAPVAAQPAPAPAAQAAQPAPAPAAQPAPAPAAQPAAQPAPAPAAQAAQPAPAPAPAAQAQPKPKAAPPKFDFSDLEALAKQIEADASKGKSIDDNYDGNVDPKKIKLSKMGN